MEGQAAEEVMATQLSLSSSMSLRELKDNAEIWICDTGATTHSSFSNMGATNETPSRSTSVGHHGEAVEAVSVMDLPGQFVTKDGELGLSGRLGEVTFNPSLNFNLFSATRMMRRGWKMYGTDNAIVLKKGEHVIVFDIVVETAKGAIYACRFMREGCDSNEITAVSTTSASGTKMSLKKAHSLLGHINIDATRAIAKVLGWNITRDKVEPCTACALAKAKQKNVCKLSERPKAVVVGGCLFIDLSVLTVPKTQGMSQIRNKNWLLVVDECSSKKWSSFFSSKNGFIEPFVEFLSQLKARGIPVLVLRMDPSGENHKLVKRLKSVECQHLQPIEIEMTARDTPQFNSLVEVAFPFLAGKARAIMNDANIPIEYRAALAILAIEFATVVDGLTAIDVEGKKMTRDQLVFGANNKWVNNMHTFGEAVVVAEGKDSKTGNRGTKMMFVGYPSNRSSDTFKLWNQNTNRVVTSRDVIWLKKMYFAPSTDDDTDITFYVDGEEAIETESSQDDDEDDGGGEDGDVEGDEATESTTPVESQRSVTFAEPVTPDRGAVVDRQATPAASNNRFRAFQDDDSSDDDSQESEVGESVVEHTSATRVADRVSRSGRRIYNTEKQNQLTGLVAIEQTYLMHLMELDNVELAATMIASELTDVNDLETSLVGAGLGGGFKNTRELKVMNYSQAMASLYKAECQEEVDNEHARFEKWEAFKPVLKSDLPHDAKVCSTTWAIKKKSNGKWRARLNLRGFEQQEDLHYNPSNISAPVTNVYTVRLLLILWCLNPSWVGKLMDVCAAFLQGEFQDGEVIYIKVPQGFEKYYSEDVVLQVLVPLYGMKQAGAAFYNTLVKKIIKSDGAQLERSKADPCVYFMNRDNKLVAVMASWVDDMMIVGEPDAAEEIQCILESSFECEREGDLLEYVGSKISMTTREDGGRSIKITQPVLMQKLKDEFLPDVEGPASKTPATPGQILVQGDGSCAVVGAEAKNYRSCVALCSYVSQHSRPECANAVRGLSRQMSNPREAHVSAMNTLVRHLLSTSNRGWRLSPTGQWDGSCEFEFTIRGISDSDYAGNTDDRRSISGTVAYVNDAPAIVRSSTQKHVTLSVTEAEGAAAVSCTQDMLYLFNLIKSIGCRVKLPMLLEVDNKGAVDLANNHKVGGRMRHVDVRNHFMRELKDEGMLVIKHIPGSLNEADILTKNTAAPIFSSHVSCFVGEDEYTESPD